MVFSWCSSSLSGAKPSAVIGIFSTTYPLKTEGPTPKGEGT
jgi:hypothetical protein